MTVRSAEAGSLRGGSEPSVLKSQAGKFLSGRPAFEFELVARR
jgi:hypothetical protein